MSDADRPVRFTRITPDGGRAPVTRAVAVECPIALEYNGIGYAVLMATPADLDDLATGFALSERLIDTAADIIDIDIHEAPQGLLLRIRLIADRHDRILARVRHRVAESSCGLCGIENLEQALRPLPRVTAVTQASDDALFRALDALDARQPGNQRTGALHAAALAAPDGTLRFAREDVGRHNAFDKLIGAMARAGLGWDGGFALLSSRCSYELVEKAALAACPLLVTLSAPTSLALDRAAESGLRLITLARRDAMLERADGPAQRNLGTAKQNLVEPDTLSYK
ncbi:formate dehydrogenase accessory sulfurtransferase FdhD [Sphingobium yanoikuyae]|uniref:Sulfur carrier protein FdhD n=1 Tax=Sphingobium yanoikuyae TaxID=13690 RepID=A0A6M4GC50_SPHYA|nr:formate dehydrogenase accessory sulfurtransferase FdhD [Sphingobium yanoikuyae]QJR04819.1 formate dehydrogenase accessory sulfurtransferase FdhD [Sphingobium yanoikuyae]